MHAVFFPKTFTENHFLMIIGIIGAIVCLTASFYVGDVSSRLLLRVFASLGVIMAVLFALMISEQHKDSMSRPEPRPPVHWQIIPPIVEESSNPPDMRERNPSQEDLRAPPEPTGFEVTQRGKWWEL